MKIAEYRVRDGLRQHATEVRVAIGIIIAILYLLVEKAERQRRRPFHSHNSLLHARNGRSRHLALPLGMG